MKHLILSIYELLTVLLPFVVTFALLTKKDKQNNKAYSMRHLLMLCVFAVYIFGVLFITGPGTIYDLIRYRSEMQSSQYNLIPFSQDIHIIQYLLNVLLFIPLGILLPLIWPNSDKLEYVFLFGLSFSLLIEIGQLLNWRATDVDDLIMNTVGAMLGYLICKLFAHITTLNHKLSDCPKYESFVYAGTMFLGHFLLFNQYDMIMILFGF